VKKKTEILVDHGHPPVLSNDKENVKECKDMSIETQDIGAKDDIYKALGWDDVDDMDELA